MLSSRQTYVDDGFDEGGSCEVTYTLWTYTSASGWRCTTDSNWMNGSIENFEDNYKNLTWIGCENKFIYLDNEVVKSINASSCMEDESPNSYTYSYNKISSYIEHKSPTTSELQGQMKNMISQSLPSDKIRYIDFISAIWNNIKIDYPRLFQLKLEDQTDISFENISIELDKILDEKSDEINEIIRENSPENLSWDSLTFYNYLKTGDYPVANIDLAKILRDKDPKTITIDNESKELSYYDILLFSIYWNNLNSVSAKYGFVFDNYLTDQFWFEENKYYLPKNKKQYEVAYLWAPWDAKNMYIKLDPEAKADNPYASVISDNAELWWMLMWANIWAWNIEPAFKCAPPDGVPIWEWIPAIFCRIWNMLPPSISISDWACGPSMLSAEEQEELNQCNWDIDKNWVNDCIEQKLDDWVLELYSDSEKYFYNKNAKLKAVIKDKDWKVVTMSNATDIHFELVKIETVDDKDKEFDETNTKIVYDKNDEYNQDNSVVSDYVVFKDLKIRSSVWAADYWIGLKSSDSNIFLRAYISIKDTNNEEAIFMESDLLEIKIRWDRLFNTSYKFDKNDSWFDVTYWANSLKVSDKNNLFLVDGSSNNINDLENLINTSTLSDEKIAIFVENISSDWTKLPILYPIELTLIEWEENIVETLTITESELSSFKALFGLDKSWSYKIEIVDSAWFKTSKKIELLPEIPHSLSTNLGTTIVENWWNITTNFITIYDKYLNPVSWEFYNLDFSIDWESLVFLDNDSNSLSTTTFEWYKIFRLKSTNNVWVNDIKTSLSNLDGEELLNEIKTIKVLDNIDFVVESIDNIVKVWWWTYKYNISLKDENWDLIQDFDSRLYLVADPIFIETDKPYIDLVWGEAEIEFRTKTLAWKNIPLEFQVEWLNKIVQKQITIFPEVAMKMDLVLSNNKIEASSDSVSNLSIELKDRYNNLVFNDDTTNTNIEILSNYSNIISVDNDASVVSWWKASYKIYWTTNPWVAYFKVWTTPSLSLNSFTISDETGEVDVHWVWENAWKIETFYFWNEKKLNGNKYNSVYTTLVWSNYWDITQQDYLAWSLLFEKENRSLAVTSLLNNSFRYNNIAHLDESWAINNIYTQDDLSQDIDISTTFIDNKLALNLYNNALNIYLWQIYYWFADDTYLVSCENSIMDCFKENETSIVLKSTTEDYSTYYTDDKLILRDIHWANLLEVLHDGTINRLWNVVFEIDDENVSKNLIVSIKKDWNIVAKLWFWFKNWNINISRDQTVFDNKINNLTNHILVLLKTNSYSAYNQADGSSNNLMFYYNDPFDTEFSLDTFTKSNSDWYENFVNRWW
jgi:hypothetical protein